ncbi:MAG: hypothetical protein AB7F35_30085 [Acetobacteraceae bacterium]
MNKRWHCVCAGLLMLATAGCSAEHLRDMTIAATATLSDLQYQMVLDNLAMMSVNPELIPWHAKLDSGTVQLNDEVRTEVGVGAAQWGRLADWIQGRAMLVPRRQRTQQWDILPVTSPRELRDLQAAYQKALGYTVGQGLLKDLDVPTGWFGKGTQEDMPEDAAFSGHYRNRYVWVMPDKVESLSKLTLIVLAIVEIKSGERSFGRGLISTPN